MGNNVDEVSETLGYIKAHVTVLVERQKEINDKLTVMNGSVAKAHNRIDDIEPDVEDYRTTKKRAILGLIGLGGVSGFGGGKIASLITTIFGAPQ